MRQKLINQNRVCLAILTKQRTMSYNVSTQDRRAFHDFPITLPRPFKTSRDAESFPQVGIRHTSARALIIQSGWQKAPPCLNNMVPDGRFCYLLCRRVTSVCYCMANGIFLERPWLFGASNGFSYCNQDLVVLTGIQVGNLLR